MWQRDRKVKMSWSNYRTTDRVLIFLWKAFESTGETHCRVCETWPVQWIHCWLQSTGEPIQKRTLGFYDARVQQQPASLIQRTIYVRPWSFISEDTDRVQHRQASARSRCSCCQVSAEQYLASYRSCHWPTHSALPHAMSGMPRPRCDQHRHLQSQQINFSSSI